jgi:hypothetical protein
MLSGSRNTIADPIGVSVIGVKSQLIRGMVAGR